MFFQRRITRSILRYNFLYTCLRCHVYDIKRRRWDFLTETGHTETIFDVHFKPSNPDVLATASFDTTVKIWNIATMKCIESLPGHESVVYAYIC
jgi:WD40 repeat protein